MHGHTLEEKIAAVFAIGAMFAVMALLFAGCAWESGGQPVTQDSGPDHVTVPSSQSSQDDVGVRKETGDSAESDSGQGAGTRASSSSSKADNEGVQYPIGWLTTDCVGLSAGTPVEIVYLPEIEVFARVGGAVNKRASAAQLESVDDSPPSDKPILKYEKKLFSVDAECILVNLPDVLPEEAYDVVYSYSSTSNCAGEILPGVTGARLTGYADGKQNNAYLARREFVVPCAYATAAKLTTVASSLKKRGYLLLVYDVYRPMSAQNQLSEAFQNAYESNDDIKAGVGEWPLNWYVASGASGHNYGTDIDVGLCDLEGNPLQMPSEFDAFDERGHLTDQPIGASEIQPDLYCETVKANEACIVLHDEFRKTGCTELASEWWHFGDEETEVKMRYVIGEGGLDIFAEMPDAHE